MKKLFEIPIYALSPVELSRRANQKITTLEEQFARTDEETRMRIIDRETFPMRNWDYNHVIGYVQLSLTQQEIVAAVFMPVPSPARYYWDSERKFFVRNLFANGMHVYIGDMKTNNEIRDAMTELLEQAIKDHLHGRFYADRAAFDTLNGHIDYLSLLQEL
jgi:hypothetical protein